MVEDSTVAGEGPATTKKRKAKSKVEEKPTAEVQAGAGQQQAGEEKKEPALYFVRYYRKADKVNARHARRKARKEAREAEELKKRKAKGRKAEAEVEEEEKEEEGEEDEEKEDDQEEGDSKGPAKKKRKVTKAAAADAGVQAEEDDKVESQQEQPVADAKPEDAAPAAEEAKPEAGPSNTEMQASFRPAGFFSDMLFEDLAVCEPLKRGLRETKFEKLTEIQAKSVPHLLAGKDVLAAAKTGSGKTLAFLVPAIDTLYNVKFVPRNGVGALVISPTRELAFQIYDVLRNISQYVSQTHGVAIGGMNRRAEAEKLAKGVNHLIATPGRLLDHMQNTKAFMYHNLVCLTIDEADRILEVGFEEEMNVIIKLLPKKRQTALFSATQTRKVADLARLSLTKPVFVEVKTQDNVATVSGLTQGYVVVPAQSRFMLLFTFLKKNRDKKVMVFFSSCNSVKYHDELLNYIDIPVNSIHGQKKQTSRSSTYYNFCSATTGILLCTDVAARGLDIPKVDWIVQYDPPDEPKEYIHRVGRTARGADAKGKALLFLLPEELGFLQYLRKAGVPVSEYSFPTNKVANIQNQLERVLEKNYHLHRSSRDAYRSYMHAYAAHSHKDCFDVHKLDLQQVAKAFGFTAPPKVDLNLKHTPRKKGKVIADKYAGMSSGHVFSAANPYGKRGANDKRQFSR